MSNFLGTISDSSPASSILSMNELMFREGVNLQKGMNYRTGKDALSVFLVLPTHDGEYKDEWNSETNIYTFEGHDSTTVEAGGKSKDQLLMYESGKYTENGKFYKAANEYKDGLRDSPLQIQIYEKIDAGVWFDKGIFELIDARGITEEGSKVYKFDLHPVGDATAERILSVGAKIAVWQKEAGRCQECGLESGLQFVSDTEGDIHLRCALHSGLKAGLLGL